MVQKGHEVKVISLVSDYKKETTWANARYCSYEYRFLNFPSPIFSFVASPLLRDWLFDLNWADVTYLSFMDPVFVSLFSLRNKPIVVGLHGVTDLNGIGSKLLKIFFRAWKFSIVIHALNQAQTNFFRIGGMSVVSIPSAVPSDLFVNNLEINEVFRIWFPSMEWFKGADRLIKLARLCKKRLPEVRFVVTGSGHMEEIIRKTNQTLENIEIRPNLKESDLIGVYASSSLFLCLSRSESFSRAAAEAQVNGLPVISTPTDGTRDILSDNTLGVLQEYNVEVFFETIFSYYKFWKEDKKGYLELKLKIAKIQRARLCWSTMVEQLDKYLLSLSEGSSLANE